MTVTNKIYAACCTNGTVTVIDGNTNIATTAADCGLPLGGRGNPATSKIYVANRSLRGRPEKEKS